MDLERFMKLLSFLNCNIEIINNSHKAVEENTDTIKMTELPKEDKITKPENPISFENADELCNICLVRPVCAEMCEVVKNIYRSHVVSRDFDERNHYKKYKNEYDEMMERYRNQ